MNARTLVQGTIRHYAVMLWTVFALVVAYHILIPPTGDIETGLAWADLTSRGGWFPDNLNDYWLSRGFGYKIAIAAMSHLSRLIAGDDLRARFYVFDAAYIAFCVAILACACRAFLSRRDGGQAQMPSRRDRAEALALGVLVFLPATVLAWEQDTHLGVVLCVLGIALALSPSPRANWSSGIVLVLLFSVKGITALYFLFVLAAAIATGDRQRICRVVAGAAIASLAIVVALATFMRPELHNLLLAAQFRVSIALADWPRSFVNGAVEFGSHAPAVPIGLLALSYAGVRHPEFFRRDRHLTGLLIATWLVALLIVVTQAEFFGHHYQSFVVPAYLSMFALYRAEGGRAGELFHLSSARDVTKILVVAVCCIDILTMAISFRPYSTYGPFRFYSFASEDWVLACEIRTGQQIHDLIVAKAPDPEANIAVLNLHSPVLSYGLQLGSASRFFYPLPLWPLPPGTQAGRDLLRQAANFQGNFVVTGKRLTADPYFAPVLAHLVAEFRPVPVQSACAHAPELDATVWIRAAARRPN